MNNKKKEKDQTSSEASVEAGKKAIEIQKKTEPVEEHKTDAKKKEDAEQWRNEG